MKHGFYVSDSALREVGRLVVDVPDPPPPEPVPTLADEPDGVPIPAEHVAMCPACQGEGRIKFLDSALRAHNELCKKCGGWGKVRRSPLTKSRPALVR